MSLRVLFLLIVTGVTWRGAGAQEAEPGLHHELIFSHHATPDRSDYDIWRMCADGTQIASVLTEPGQQIQVSIAPDGDRFAYNHRDGEGGSAVWISDFRGGNREEVAPSEATDSGPAWSPDGMHLAFTSTRDQERPEVYVVHLETRDLRRLTDNANHEGGLAWAPDGGTLYFTRYITRDSTGSGEIIAFDMVTGQERQLTELGGYNGDVDVSPDGRHLAFHRAAEDGSDLWVMKADGTDASALMEATPLDEYTPRYSPDGAWIAYSAGTASDNVGTFDLWLVRTDGTEARPISSLPNTQAWHAWRPQHRCR